MHIAFVTAGGAGMFCGSCMQDNALARALMQSDCEVSLIPTYTPLRLDQEDVSEKRIFLGGINLYLDNAIPGWRYLPRILVSWLDRPGVLRWATQRGIENDASKLGAMTLAMLQGSHGAMRREYAELVHYLVSLRPDAILFSNALLSGVLPLLRESYSGPVFCLLQGDDIFLDQLPQKFHDRVLEQLRENSKQFDLFLTHSRFYADYISNYIGLPRDKFEQLPLAIDTTIAEPQKQDYESQGRPVRVGYFARIAPEKGLLELAAAAAALHTEGLDIEVHAGGYFGPAHKDYMDQIHKAAESLGDRFHYIGSPDTDAQKRQFLKTMDLLCVPVNFEEPKGLYALEAMSQGVPVVLPQRGGLTELVADTGSGLTYSQEDPEGLKNALRRLIRSAEERHQFGQAGVQAVRERHSTQAAARHLLNICRKHETANS
ncbi:MAG: hexosyltransferase [Planctomyces sp.]|nr:hexosyltransferase [Planctomyces sp.]